MTFTMDGTGQAADMNMHKNLTYRFASGLVETFQMRATKLVFAFLRDLAAECSGSFGVRSFGWRF